MSMDVQMFYETLKDEVSAITGKEYTLGSVTKVNDTSYVSLHEVGEGVVPMVYLNDFYYENITHEEISKLAEKLVREVLNTAQEVDFDITSLQDFNWAVSRLVFSVVNTAKNTVTIQDTPHRSFLDLTIQYRIEISQDVETGCNASILVHNSLLETWGVTEATLYHRALFNTPKYLGVVFDDMVNVMRSLLQSKDLSPELMPDGMRGGMYVLTNKVKSRGSALIACPNVLYDIYVELGENFYILPSSLHELIIIPVSGAVDADNLQTIVKDVNTTTLGPDEYLSDSVYLYRADVNEVILC